MMTVRDNACGYNEDGEPILGWSEMAEELLDVVVEYFWNLFSITNTMMGIRVKYMEVTLYMGFLNPIPASHIQERRSRRGWRLG